MKKIIHRSGDRGQADYGWLKTRYSFSFAEWHDPTKIGFGALRVLNDDHVSPKSGFPMHSHRDFEIITIVIKGAVTHEDSLGNKGVVSAGEVQAMSAGTGVTHSEYNEESESLELFQIWIETNKKGANPRYSQKSFSENKRKNSWQLVVSQSGESNSLPIYQDAKISLSSLDKDIDLVYKVKNSTHGVYIFLISGEVEVLGENLSKRDAIGVSGIAEFSVSSKEESAVMVMEVPMK